MPNTGRGRGKVTALGQPGGGLVGHNLIWLGQMRLAAALVLREWTHPNLRAGAPPTNRIVPRNSRLSQPPLTLSQGPEPLP